MWICLNDAFLSVVSDKFQPSRLMVRARRKQDLLNVFGPQAEIVETADADYRWRTFVDRQRFKQILNERIDTLDYTNFKNSVRSRDLHNMYMEIWQTHKQYQDED